MGPRLCPASASINLAVVRFGRLDSAEGFAHREIE